jgi:NAD(P)-dependent dehydrogenase (short-subunit alcohol dehydrogenase family)
MVAKIEEELGSISVLVNNAGIARPQKIEEITEQDWDELLDANLKSAFLVTQAVLPAMRARNAGDESLTCRRLQRRLVAWWDRTMLRPRRGCMGLRTRMRLYW